MTTKKKFLTFLAILALPIAGATGYALRANASDCGCGAACACDVCDGGGDCSACAGGCDHNAP
ncbi:MAG: hypothetical protein IPH72_21195 [Sandaracinaceae bacterium]|nr:hypothetical protein [Sandaracinaceae bacterium]MBP7682427.1 hypothetical protein [Deltaproteobacteria bacterium]